MTYSKVMGLQSLQEVWSGGIQHCVWGWGWGETPAWGSVCSADKSTTHSISPGHHAIASLQVLQTSHVQRTPSTWLPTAVLGEHHYNHLHPSLKAQEAEVRSLRRLVEVQGR